MAHSPGGAFERLTPVGARQPDSPSPINRPTTARRLLDQVPVHASALVSLAAKASLKANEQVSIATWARETSHATFGVKYSDGEWGKVAETASPTFSYELPTFNAARSATVTVSIQPTIQLSIDFLGGPTCAAAASHPPCRTHLALYPPWSSTHLEFESRR